MHGHIRNKDQKVIDYTWSKYNLIQWCVFMQQEESMIQRKIILSFHGEIQFPRGKGKRNKTKKKQTDFPR